MVYRVRAVDGATTLISTNQLAFVLHMSLGVVIMHGFVLGLMTVLRPAGTLRPAVGAVSTVALALAAWVTAATGTWLIYPGYRAAPADLTTTDPAALLAHPKYALLADPATAVWHDVGMEWKEHVGWLVPLLATAVAYLVVRHRDLLVADRTVRGLAAGLLVVSIAASVVASGLGAVINVVAPNQFLN